MWITWGEVGKDNNGIEFQKNQSKRGIIACRGALVSIFLLERREICRVLELEKPPLNLEKVYISLISIKRIVEEKNKSKL